MKNVQETIYLGTDHAGLKLKIEIKAYLVSLKYHVVDAGAFTHISTDDYPDYVFPAVQEAVKDKARAIVFGGTGLGECIAANKVEGARAVCAYDVMTARLSREHNDSNVLSLGGRTVTKDVALAKRIVKKWLDTPFSGDTRHKRRLRKIAKYEN